MVEDGIEYLNGNLIQKIVLIFRVIFMRDEDGEYIEGHKRVGDDIKITIKLNLYVGYSSKEH